MPQDDLHQLEAARSKSVTDMRRGIGLYKACKGLIRAFKGLIGGSYKGLLGGFIRSLRASMNLEN